MTKHRKNKEEEIVRVINSKDKVWKGIENITKGMNPSERAKFMIDFVNSIPPANSKNKNLKS